MAIIWNVLTIPSCLASYHFRAIIVTDGRIVIVISRFSSRDLLFLIFWFRRRKYPYLDIYWIRTRGVRTKGVRMLGGIRGRSAPNVYIKYNVHKRRILGRIVCSSVNIFCPLNLALIRAYMVGVNNIRDSWSTHRSIGGNYWGPVLSDRCTPI